MMTANSKMFYAALLWILLAINIVGFATAGLYHVTRPYELNYGEGIVVYQAAHVTDRALAYGPINRYPFIVYHYPPVFYLASRAVHGVIGGDLLNSGRLVSFLSGLLLSAVTGYLSWACLPTRIRPRVRWIASVAAAVLPFTYYNYSWTWLARVDTISLLLASLGLALFVRLRSSFAGDAVIAALFVAAVFAKHITLAPIVACLLTAAVLDRKRAVRLLIIVAVLGGVSLGVVSWFTHGGILRHLFLYNKNPFSVRRAISGSLMNLGHVGIIAGVAAAGIIYDVRRLYRHFRRTSFSAWVGYLRASRGRMARILLTAYCLLAAMVTVAFGKEGSSVNYFLEWNVSMAPLFILAMVRWLPSERATRIVPYQIFFLLMVPYLLLPKPGADGWFQTLYNLRTDDPQFVRDQTEVMQILRTAQGEILSEDMTLLNFLGKEITEEPAITASLAATGTWDERPVVAMIREHRFSYIVAYDLDRKDRWFPKISEAVKSAYSLDRVIGKYNLYTPR